MYFTQENSHKVFLCNINNEDDAKVVNNDGSSDNGRFHPTQKPVALLEYLIKTYTNDGEAVLDFTAGSFSTGVACINTGRKFIGIEMNEEYFNIGVNRMSDVSTKFDIS